MGMQSSGASTSETDIANGVRRNHAETRTILRAPLYYSAPTGVETQGSGAAPNFGYPGVDLTSGTAGDYGRIHAGSPATWSGNDMRPKATLVKATYNSESGPGILAATHTVGLLANRNNPPTPGDNDIAAFFPHVGNNTSGNVRVDNGGNDTDGSVDYSDTTASPLELAVLIDHDGVFLSAGHTGFYINKDPRTGDTPDADLAAVPGVNSNGQTYGIGYESAGQGQSMHSTYLEVVQWGGA